MSFKSNIAMSSGLDPIDNTRSTRIGTADDPTAEQEETILNMKSLKNGRTLKWVVIFLIIFTGIILITSGIGVDKTPKKATQHYIFAAGCGLSSIILIIEFIFLFTVVKSLEIEDILASGMQRLFAGSMQVGDFQEIAGRYFKDRLADGTLDGLSEKQAGRKVGEALLDSYNATQRKKISNKM